VSGPNWAVPTPLVCSQIDEVKFMYVFGAKQKTKKSYISRGNESGGGTRHSLSVSHLAYMHPVKYRHLFFLSSDNFSFSFFLS